MVATFNEGEEVGKRTKQWTITPNDGLPIAVIARITDRMPAILPRETWATWLGETDAPLDDVKALLQTFEDGGNWTMTPQQPSRAPRPLKLQGELF